MNARQAGWLGCRSPDRYAAVVLGEVACVRPVDGHPADRVEEHDVVDGGALLGDRALARGHGGRSGRRNERCPPATHLHELRED
jgi:hypothetical protein